MLTLKVSDDDCNICIVLKKSQESRRGFLFGVQPLQVLLLVQDLFISVDCNLICKAVS